MQGIAKIIDSGEREVYPFSKPVISQRED